jgi:sodium-dependent phosphate cotransporter
VLTALVQSSSITTSLVVPLAGAGILTLVQIFPYTLGANIGTTVTAMLAALVTGNLASVSVAFSHLLFNLSGIFVWWPFKFIPIILAQKFSELAMRKKAIPVLYIIVVFFLLPLILIIISE